MFFRYIPEGIFRPLVGKYRLAYAEILTRLHDGLLSMDEPEQPTKEMLVEDFDEALRRHMLGLKDTDREEFRLTPVDAYNELRDSGWLTEIREGWTVYVEMDQPVATLLEGLCRVGYSDPQTFSGTVVSVVSSLNSAIENPGEQGVGLLEACRRAREFARHLRNVIGTLKSIEQAMLNEATVAGLARAFFDDFVDRVVITDYRAITSSRNNPYRHRQKILRLVDDIESDPDLYGQICVSYVSQEIAEDGAAAARLVSKHIMDIRSAFDAIERFRRRLDLSKTNIEMRFQNTLDYMDLVETGRADRFLAVMTQFGDAVSHLSLDAEVEFVTGLEGQRLVFDENKLPEPEAPRKPVQTKARRKTPPDPLWQAFESAKRVFDDRITVTPQKLRAYLNAALDVAPEIPASAIPPTDIEEFAIFSALRLLNRGQVDLGDGIVIEPLPGRVENDWIEVGNFVIRRKGADHATGT